MLRTLVLTLTLTLTLTLIFQPKPYHLYGISQGHSFLYQVRTLCDHSFLSYAPDISVKKIHLLTLWPWPLTFKPQNCNTSSVCQGHSMHQLWILCDHSFLSYAADKQTYKQTNSALYRCVLKPRSHCPTRLNSTRLDSTWVESDRAVWTLLRRDSTQLNYAIFSHDPVFYFFARGK